MADKDNKKQRILVKVKPVKPANRKQVKVIKAIKPVKPVKKTTKEVEEFITEDSVCYTGFSESGTNKLALYDMDGTLMTLSGQPIAKGLQHVMEHLEEGTWQVAIISNQYGIKKGKRTHEDVHSMYETICKELGEAVPMIYSLAKDRYRKPMTGMFENVLKLLGIQNVHKDSFFCGDAAGRKGDFSNGDALFAMNCDLNFIAAPQLEPMELSPPYVPPEPLDIGALHNLEKTVQQQEQQGKQLFITMIGPQGAGKSTLSQYIAGLLQGKTTILSKDDHGSKIDRMFTASIKAEEHVILDNTNPEASKRAKYIQEAQTAGYYCMAVQIDIPKVQSTHMCHMRVQQGGKYIPLVARHTYYKRMEAPSHDEGFKAIEVIKGVVFYPEVPDEYWLSYNLKEQ